MSGTGSASQPTDGYRLNPDGSLTLLSGSPFAIGGMLASSGNFLMVASGNAVSSYRVNPGTGAPSKVASISVGSTLAIAADEKDVYAASTASNNSLISGFHVSPSGAMSVIAGDPFFYAEVCGGCPLPNSLALNNRFLSIGAVEAPSARAARLGNGLG